MRKYLMSIVAIAALGAATPAFAYDTSAEAPITIQDALFIASDIGVVAVSDTQFAGDEWQIEGRDITGRFIEVDVDATTGAILNVDR
jgi:hypothetical protein